MAKTPCTGVLMFGRILLGISVFVYRSGVLVVGGPCIFTPRPMPHLGPLHSTVAHVNQKPSRLLSAERNTDSDTKVMYCLRKHND